MNFKEGDDFYFQGKDFFVGQPIGSLHVNAVLTYAHRMNSSTNKLPCDEVIINACNDGALTPQIVGWYQRTRRFVINEIRINSGGAIEFGVTRIPRVSHPEPDF